MKASLYHIQLNVSDSKKSLPFYRDLLTYFEYEIIDESDEHIGASNNTTDFWILQAEHKDNVFHRKNAGVNHIAFKVASKEEVDQFCKEFLAPRNITTLYDSPKPFTEYSEDYYAVFFEDPDRLKIEVVSCSEK